MTYTPSPGEEERPQVDYSINKPLYELQQEEQPLAPQTETADQTVDTQQESPKGAAQEAVSAPEAPQEPEPSKDNEEQSLTDRIRGITDR